MSSIRRSFSRLRCGPLIFRIAQLKRADVPDDPPAIVFPDTLVVAVHSAIAVRDDVVKVPRRRVAESIEIKRWRFGKSALHDHASPIAKSAVTGRAKYVEPLVADVQI